MKTKVIFNNGQLCAVIWMRGNNVYVVTEKYSSMGFYSEDGAISYVVRACKGEPLTPDNQLFKNLPGDIQVDIENTILKNEHIKCFN